MFKKTLAILAVAALAVFATVTDARITSVADYSVATSVSKAVGTVKTTGTEKTYSRVDVSGITKDYAIDINPCSDCGSNGGTDDYKVVGDYTQVDRSLTNVNRLQTLDSTTVSEICNVETNLGGFSAGYTSVDYNTTENVVVQVNDATRNWGKSKFSGDVYKGHSKVGSVVNRTSYDTTDVANLTTTQTRNVTGWRVESFIGK